MCWRPAGASALDKANRKALAARQLQALNLRPEKGHRIPKGIGKSEPLHGIFRTSHLFSFLFAPRPLTRSHESLRKIYFSLCLFLCVFCHSPGSASTEGCRVDSFRVCLSGLPQNRFSFLPHRTVSFCKACDGVRKKIWLSSVDYVLSVKIDMWIPCTGFLRLRVSSVPRSSTLHSFTLQPLRWTRLLVPSPCSPVLLLNLTS